MNRTQFLLALLLTTLSSSEVQAKDLGNKVITSNSAFTQIGNGEKYAMTGTEVWNVGDAKSDRKYQIFVALPNSYSENPQKRYSVLFVTDADYGFPVVRQIARRLNGGTKKLDDFILVGLSYAIGEDSMSSRRRDYTPSSAGARDAPPGAVHGESQKYMNFLADTVFPIVDDKYRTKEDHRIFLGHSYGGLLGLNIVFQAPGMFSEYIIGSPSLWYDDNMMADVEASFAKRNKDLKASIYMYVGEYEDMIAGDSRYARRYNMVSDARRMERALRSRSYPSLRIKMEILNDEDHFSVAPRGFTKGLKHFLAADAE